MTALPPPSPVYRHRDDVWIKESWIRFTGLTLQTRMVVVKLEGGLLLYSPTPAVLDDATREELRSLGQVRWLVAPNEIHNVGLPAFQRAYPDAHVTGCAGHPRRVRGVRFDVLLDAASGRDAVPWTASGEIDLHVIGGNRFLHEIALLHRPSKTLIVTDAIEVMDERHLGGELPGRLMTWMLRRMGLHWGTPCASPEHRLYCSDADALDASLRALEAWDFDSIVMAHGRVLQADEARSALRVALEPAIAAARTRGTIARGLWEITLKLQ